MLVQKNLSMESADLKVEDDTGKFSGYASVWGGVDSYGDTIVRGAFTSTLRAHGKPKMFFNHSWDMPIGKYTKVTEDDHGLLVEGQLTPGLAKSADVLAAMRHGTLDALSIGGFLKAGDYEETETGRLIRKWSNLVEVSPVVFPADGAAKISSVKQIDFEDLLPECKTERDIERLLRDAGLGKWEAAALVSRVKAILMGRDAQEGVDETKMAVMKLFQRMAIVTA